MNKKELLVNYLNNNLFMPIMHSPYASSQLKYNLDYTRNLIINFSAQGIICYIWTMFGNDEVKMILNNRLLDEGFNCYDTVVENFKNKFTYDWLMS